MVAGTLRVPISAHGVCGLLCRNPTVISWAVLSLCGLCWVVSSALAVEPTASETALQRQWAETAFDAKATAHLPFSFLVDGRPFRDWLASWQAELKLQEVDPQRTLRTITLRDPQTGLVVRCVATVYRDFPATEWVLTFKNTGSADSPVLANVQALQAQFGKPTNAGPFQLYYAEGSHERITDFQPRQQALAPDQRVRLASFGGRSSDGVLPFFNLADPAGGGVVIGVGWTGQWAATFTSPASGGVRAEAGMETTHLRLRPGEEIRTPAVLLLFWEGADRIRGQNLLRRLLLTHYTPTVGGKPVQPPLAASPHAVVGFERTTEENMLRGIHQLAARQFPVDTWWIDAGWFTCGQNWARYVGNPDPDPARFPRGMKPIADAAHRAGLKFLLWFEPERVMPDTWLHQQHPDWLRRPTDEMPAELKYQINDGFHLLDLGHPGALAWAKTKLSGMIRDIGIDIYRHDFNMYPVYYWRNGEAADRQGINEIKYVTGLYELFDTLRQQHPHLLIDNCASGGRRIDLEMLRRSLVLIRSDYLWDPIGQQCHTYGLAQWLPITGIGAASVDGYHGRSGLGAHFVLAANFYSDDATVWEPAGRILREQQSLQHLCTGDFYPLGSFSTAGTAWLAWQFHRADLDEGVVQAFRRQNSPEETARYRLCGLHETTEYAVTNWDDPQPCAMTGKELAERGLTVHLPRQPAAAIVTYRRMHVPRRGQTYQPSNALGGGNADDAQP